jgi:hypothetical protein
MRALVAVLMLLLLLGSPAFAQFEDRTVLLQHPSQGTQIVYLGPRGKTYLWYQGSSEVLEGRYYSGMMENTFCLRYGPDRYNPVTGLPAERSECTPWAAFGALMMQQVQGDIFGLSNRRDVPFALTRSTATIEALAMRAGMTIDDPVINAEDLIMRPGEGVSADVICKLHPQLKDVQYSPCAE